jgi:hypothetical protein
MLSAMPAGDLGALRRLLDDALVMAKELGDEARQEPTGVGYFAPDATSGLADAINVIGEHEGEISLFVGAGVAMEAELPSWNTLVKRLLTRAQGPLDDADAVAAWVDRVLQEGPLAAAAVAEALYADAAGFRQALREALYERDARTYVPGALASQIAWLKKQLGSRLAILTVNYDGLLEAALTERDLEFVSYVRGRAEPAGKAAVWHLHGRLIRTTSGKSWLKEGNLVLSEGSYVQSTTRPFPQEFVASRLRSSLCVFVGLSMTDPNFIRWLYNSADEAGGPRFVIFVRQAATVADPRVRVMMEQSAAARWAQVGVTPVWANYYGEVAQIIHEIGLKASGGPTLDFATRARTRLAYGAARLNPSDPPDFVEAQQEGSEWLRDRLDGVRAICRTTIPPVDLTTHHLGVGLWAIDHASGEIMNWVSSDRVYKDPSAIMRNPLHVGSRWVAAVAIANGVSVEQDPRVYAWRFIRGIPIVVDPNGERSTVGALTMTSTTPLADFPLARSHAPTGLLGVVDEYLASQAGEFFLP